MRKNADDALFSGHLFFIAAIIVAYRENRRRKCGLAFLVKRRFVNMSLVAEHH